MSFRQSPAQSVLQDCGWSGQAEELKAAQAKRIAWTERTGRALGHGTAGTDAGWTARRDPAIDKNCASKRLEHGRRLFETPAQALAPTALPSFPVSSFFGSVSAPAARRRSRPGPSFFAGMRGLPPPHGNNIFLRVGDLLDQGRQCFIGLAQFVIKAIAVVGLLDHGRFVTECAFCNFGQDPGA
jgi:hypothetical protein